MYDVFAKTCVNYLWHYILFKAENINYNVPFNGNDDFMKMRIIFHSREIHPTECSYRNQMLVKFSICYILFREHLPQCYTPIIIIIRVHTREE